MKTRHYYLHRHSQLSLMAETARLNGQAELCYRLARAAKLALNRYKQMLERDRSIRGYYYN